MLVWLPVWHWSASQLLFTTMLAWERCDKVGLGVNCGQIFRVLLLLLYEMCKSGSLVIRQRFHVAWKQLSRYSFIQLCLLPVGRWRGLVVSYIYIMVVSTSDSLWYICTILRLIWFSDGNDSLVSILIFELSEHRKSHRGQISIDYGVTHLRSLVHHSWLIHCKGRLVVLAYMQWLMCLELSVIL